MMAGSAGSIDPTSIRSILDDGGLDRPRVVVSSPIFISYSSFDQKVAETICDALQARGYSCWIACRNIGAGENFQEAIVKAIRSAKVMLLVFTSNANNSDEIKKEIVLAGRHRITVVPVRVEDVAPNDALAYEFATRQWIDLFKDWEHEIERLTSQIGTILADGGPIRDIAGDPSAKPAPPAPAKKSPPRPLIALAALLVVALGIGGAYFYLRPVASPVSQAVNDDNAWTDATNTGTVQAFREYLDRFPNGTHVADARQHIQAADDKAWADADGAGTIVALNRYLVQFPSGAHAAQAKTSIAALEQKPVDIKPSADAHRFDGAWVATISCSAVSGAQAYVVRITSQVNDGVFHGQRGTEGKPGWWTLDGKIESDGSSDLYAQLLVASSAATIGTVPVGTEVDYHIRAHFDGSSGTGSRVDLRPCEFGAFKQEAAISPGATPDATVTSPTQLSSAPNPAGNLPALSQSGSDDDDWRFAKGTDNYDVYMAYLKAHPQGRHAAEARREAAAVRPIANALAVEPSIGELAPGATVVVDDHSCKRGEIKVITGGNIYVQPKVVRTSKCVPRDKLP
jgi:hypothetical protein